MQDPRTVGALSGMTVLDLTTFLSGPSATQTLGDLGADVIKIEAPGGDMTRGVPPHFVGDDSAYFLANNRNKRSVVLDLKNADGLDTVKQLIAKVDVVVDNFRPGVLDRLGLDVEALLAKHPALIWASISGFGQTGPRKTEPAYDMVVQALSGVMSLTGEPGGKAVRLGIPAGDTVAGLYSVIGILAAWTERERTGRGRWIDVSMLDGQLAMLSYQAVYSTVGGITPGPQGSRHDSIPTYRTFTGCDGRELAVTANTERMWVALCAVLDLDDLPADTRFETSASRLANREELWAILEGAFTRETAARWVELLESNDVPASLIKTVPEALDEARVSGRGMLVEVSHADGRKVEVLNTPIIFRGQADLEHRYPPALGEDTKEVLTQFLGVTEDRLSSLRDSGAFGLNAESAVSAGV